MKRTLKGDVVVGYLQRFPKMPKLRLAKLIYANESELFKSVEGVRAKIRYYTGSKGKQARKFIKTEKIDMRKTFSWSALPEGEKEIDWTNPTQVEGERLLLLSDVHIPYHDSRALEVAINYGLEKNVDSIYLNGDILDCYQLSKWQKDPRKKKFGEELEIARIFLKELREAFPKANIYFKEGNHEIRYEMYLISKAAELWGIPEFELARIIELDKHNISHVGSRTWAKFGRLRIAHGHEGGRAFSNPVNAARGVFLKSLQSIIIGHYHQPATHTAKNWDGEPITCWSTGALCDLHPTYAPKNNWSLGFAYVEILDEDGNFVVENKRIIKNKAIPV